MCPAFFNSHFDGSKAEEICLCIVFWDILATLITSFEYNLQANETY